MVYRFFQTKVLDAANSMRGTRSQTKVTREFERASMPWISKLISRVIDSLITSYRSINKYLFMILWGVSGHVVITMGEVNISHSAGEGMN